MCFFVKTYSVYNEVPMMQAVEAYIYADAFFTYRLGSIVGLFTTQLLWVVFSNHCTSCNRIRGILVANRHAGRRQSTALLGKLARGRRMAPDTDHFDDGYRVRLGVHLVSQLYTF